MKTPYILGFPLMALALASCGNQTERNAAREASSDAESAADTAGRISFATGEVTETSDGSMTIAHGPVEDIGWPAMTMAFEAQSPDMIQDIAVGDRVRFGFRESETGYVLTSVEKVGP